MSRWVLHIDMDAFYASCEQLTRPTLQGRPVLVAGVSGRGVVAGASYEARKYGARSAMPTQRAAQLVGPQAVLVAPRRPVYAAASRRVFEIISQRVDVVEQLSIDEAFMEPDALMGASAQTVAEWANELRAAIRAETGLPSSIGAGSGKRVRSFLALRIDDAAEHTARVASIAATRPGSPGNSSACGKSVRCTER